MTQQPTESDTFHGPIKPTVAFMLAHPAHALALGLG